MSNTVLSAPDINGISYALALNNLPHSFTYNGSNQVVTDTVVFEGITFVQTYTYSGGNVSTISRFIPQ